MDHLHSCYDAQRCGDVTKAARTGCYFLIFVPFLATEAVSDWNEGVVSEFDNALILYAQLPILTTDQFFHRLITSLLKDSVETESQKMWINAGCKEAMLPLHEPHSRAPLGLVLLRYHPIQNIIEFRLK